MKHPVHIHKSQQKSSQTISSIHV